MSTELKNHPPLPRPEEVSRFTTAELRSTFLLENLFEPGQLVLHLTDLDRAIVGSACPAPGGNAIELGAVEALRTPAFLDRRELGILNVGDTGVVEVGGETYSLDSRECLYVGRGAGTVRFRAGESGSTPAFYLVSYPAHRSYPTRKATFKDANVLNLGSKADANERTLYQYIYNGGIESCQLVMGFTELAEGSIWNTMPAHTHQRRTEVYLYFDVPENHAVLHMMGDPAETRPLWVHNRQVVLSPAWSIHCGAGTNAYRFIWAMGGENQQFDDMDAAPIPSLR